MKTIRSITIIILAVLISVNSLAMNHKDGADSKPVNENKSVKIDFEEEAYINDIPINTKAIADELQKHGKNQKRPVFIGIQPGFTVEQFYDEGEIDINVVPITIQIPVGKRVDLRFTTLANYHLGGEENGFADVGLQAVVPIYFKKKENRKNLPKGFYAGPMIGFSRNLLYEHYTTNLAAEAGYQFPTTRSFSISMGLQFGATHFAYDNQTDVWRNHFGFKINIGFWVNQGNQSKTI